jgi:hypothetical protein
VPAPRSVAERLNEEIRTSITIRYNRSFVLDTYQQRPYCVVIDQLEPLQFSADSALPTPGIPCRKSRERCERSSFSRHSTRSEGPCFNDSDCKPHWTSTNQGILLSNARDSPFYGSTIQNLLLESTIQELALRSTSESVSNDFVLPPKTRG